MKTWKDYKEYVRAVDPEAALDIAEAELLADIVSAMVKQRKKLGLSQHDLARQCGVEQSSIERIESCQTTPDLRTLIHIFQNLGLKLTISPN